MINNIVSQKLQVKPLTKGETKTYKLIGFGMPSLFKRDDRDRPIPNMPVKVLAGKEYIYDPFDKQNPRKLILNVVGMRPNLLPDGSMKQEPIIGKVPIKGMITVKHSDENLHQFLERSNRNKSNIYRDKSVTAWFEEVDVKKEIRKEANTNQREALAISMVLRADMDDIKILYKQLPESLQKLVNMDDIELAKNQLYKIAKQDPLIIIRGADGSKYNDMFYAQVTIEMETAESWNILTFSEIDRKWTFYPESGDGKPVVICTVEPGMKRMEGLLDFIMDEKNEVIYKTITKEIQNTKLAASEVALSE